MIRKAALLFSGHATAAVLSLLRNLLIARLIPVADYGIAATFALAMAMVEMATAFGLRQQIVQAKEGDDPRFQSALQGFQLLRGLVAVAALLAIAGPVAAFLKVPELAWAYRLLAVVPLAHALMHFDIHRLNRRMAFGPMLLTETLPPLAALLAVWPLFNLFGDWRVMLATLVLQAWLAVVVSHLVAERPFRLRLDRAEMGRSFRFGWPLLLNGVLLYLTLQGDKLMVGRLLGMEPLALFAMGVTLTLTPTLVMAKTTQNLFLPRLSRIEAGAPGFQGLGRATLQAAMLNGGLIVLGTVLVGAPFVALALGDKYAGLVPLLVPLAVLHAVRVWKTGAAVVALSRGQTGNAMAANLPRVLALPLGWWLLQEGGTLLQLIWLGTAAEGVGLAVALMLVRGRGGLRLGPHAPALAGGVLFLAVSGVLALPPGLLLPGTPVAGGVAGTLAGGLPPVLPAWVPMAAAVVVFALFAALLGDLRRAVRGLRKGGDGPRPGRDGGGRNGTRNGPRDDPAAPAQGGPAMMTDSALLASPLPAPAVATGAGPATGPSADTPPLLIHVGYHKTATTWMQRRLFTPVHGFRQVAGHAEAFAHVVAPHGLAFDPGPMQAAIAQGMAALQPGEVPVISSEILSGLPFEGGRDSDVYAERLARIAPGARILISIRSQLKILPSVYMQYLRRGGTQPRDRFFAGTSELGYFAFDPAHFEYDRLVGRYQRLFGAENVYLLTQESLARDAGAAAQRLADFAGAARFAGLEARAKKSSGVSDPEYAAPVLRRINHVQESALNPWPVVHLGRLPGGLHGAAAWLLRRPPLFTMFGRRRPVSDHVRARFATRFTESNARLAAMVAHPLDLTGYP